MLALIYKYLKTCFGHKCVSEDSSDLKKAIGIPQ